MTELTNLVAACNALSADARYPKKTRALAVALAAWSTDVEQREAREMTAIATELLGPFEIRYDDAGLYTTGFPVGDILPVGTVIMAAWIGLEVPWDSDATGSELRLDLWWENGGGPGVPGPLNENVYKITPAIYDIYGDDPSSYPILGAARDSLNPGVRAIYMPPYVVTGTGVQLAITWRTDPGTPTQGLAVAYAVIASPAT